jgi:hypothetical protein
MHNRMNNDILERESYQEGEEKRNFGSQSSISNNLSSYRPQYDEQDSSGAAGGTSSCREVLQGRSYRSSLLAMNPSSLSSEIPGITRGLQENFSKREDGVASSPSSAVRLPTSNTEYTANASLQTVASRSTPPYHSYYLQNQPSIRTPQTSSLQGSAPIPQNVSISAVLHEVQESQARLMIHINRASELVQKSPPTSRLSMDEHQTKLPVAEKKIVIPCRARGMPADHSTKVSCFRCKLQRRKGHQQEPMNDSR